MTRFSRPIAVLLISASTLAYEILLVRAFAIEHFSHFAYMAIGVAMLGYGASGTFMALVRRPGRERTERWFARAALATPVSLIASAALVHQIPLDATQLLWDTWQWPRLAGVYLLLALPFGVGALAVLSAIALESDRPGWIYGASFLGAGMGAILAVAILWLVAPDRALAVPAVIGGVAATAATLQARGSRSRLRGASALAVLSLTVGVFVTPLWRLEISPYKGLPQVEAYPNAVRVAEHTSPLGWVVAVEADAFRHAPGLSLVYSGAFPGQVALFVDGQVAGAVSRWGADGAALAILDWLPSAIPYALGGREKVLVLGAGGGLEVWSALQHGARRVSAVELHPDVVELANSLGDGLELGAEASTVEWEIGDARSLVARSREEFDLIALGPGGAFATGAAGVHSLSEDFLHTVDAYVDYLSHLRDGGVLAITRWVTVPPRGSVRVILTAAEALRRAAPESLASGLVVVRSWATATVLVRPGGFSEQEVDALASWSAERRFDLDWYPGARVPGSQFNILEGGTLFEAAAAAVAGSESASLFASSQPFDVAPVRDSRPYPHHFIKPGSLRALVRSGRGSWLPFAEWGYIALLATLAQSVILAGVLMLIPAVLRVPRGGARGWVTLAGYFTAIGLAYLAAEIAAIQQFNLLLGHPVYAVAAVLAAFLTFSGAGSVWSDRIRAGRAWMVCLSLAVVLTACAGILLALVHVLQPGNLILRSLVAVLILAPLAFLMGLPFPMGIRRFAGGDVAGVAWAWAANGFASVVAAPLAALIALEVGSQALFLVAAASYGAAGVLSNRFAPIPTPGG